MAAEKAGSSPMLASYKGGDNARRALRASALSPATTSRTPAATRGRAPGSASNYMLASYAGPRQASFGTKAALRPPAMRTLSMMTSQSATANAVSSSVPMAVYLYAGDQIIENVTSGYFYYQDSLGNTSHVTDAVGNLLERYTYSAFGTPSFYNAAGTQISSSTNGIRHLFQGQLWTQETGLNDYRNRVELPSMGVFLQPDPIGFKGDAANIYRFCGNNAVNRIDPMGLDFTAEIVLRENLDNIPGINSPHFGGTAGTLDVRAEVINGRIVYHDVDIHATSYVRTRGIIDAPFYHLEYNRSRQDIVRTVQHEAEVHLRHHEQYYANNRDAVRRDFEDGKSYTAEAGKAKINEKKEAWRKSYREDYLSRGKNADRGRLERDTSTSGNEQTPSGQTGPQESSAAALDAALRTLLAGPGGGEPGEGFHPRGPR